MSITSSEFDLPALGSLRRQCLFAVTILLVEAEPGLRATLAIPALSGGGLAVQALPLESHPV